MNNLFTPRNASRMGRVLILLAILASLYVGMKFVNEVKAFNSVGTDTSNVSTIDVTGTGTAFAIPDIANESFTIQDQAATVHDAQTIVTSKVNSAVAFLKTSGIADADVQTTDYSAYPQYTYPVPCTGKDCPATGSDPTVSGYTVSDTVSVKIRDTSAVGKIVDGLGALGVTGLSGPNFTVDNPDTITASARAMAINDARAKADVLAKELGVTLVRVVRFSEDNGGGIALPMYAKSDGGISASAPTPAIPAGQNKYTSNVTITYQIQ